MDGAWMYGWQVKHVLTVNECCEALRMGYNAVYELLNSGKLKAYKNGRVWLISKAAVIRYVMENSGL